MTILVPKCKIFTGSRSTLKDLCEDLVDHLKDNNNLEFMTRVSVGSSGGGKDDRIILEDTDGGRLWIGHTENNTIGFIVDPLGELNDANSATGNATSRSHLRELSQNGFDGRFIWIEYPDAFMLSFYEGFELKGISHGGRIVTTWNASDAAQGITGHMLTVSTNGWWDNASPGHMYRNNYSLRVDHQLWAGGSGGYSFTHKPTSVDAIRPNFPWPMPAIVGPATSAAIGFTKYARRDPASNSYGSTRMSFYGDQAWLSPSAGGTTAWYHWYLWDRRVNPMEE